MSKMIEVSEDELVLIRAVFVAMVRRYGSDDSLTIFDHEIENEDPAFVVEDIAGGFKVHLLPDFVKTGREPVRYVDPMTAPTSGSITISGTSDGTFTVGTDEFTWVPMLGPTWSSGV